MILEEDLEFHTSDSIGYDWAETGYFNFYIPDHNIFGLIYIVHRAGVGSTVCDVEIFDSRSKDVLGPLYRNMTNHNPIPPSQVRFDLPCGLSYQAHSLRDYHLTFDDGQIAIDLTARGIMVPYDIHDPAMDPMAVEDANLAAAHSGLGKAYSAHFDMSVALEGTLRLGDRQLPINCVSTMDHSWGPRPETALHPVLWVNAHFGEGYVLHGIFSYDRDAPKGAQHEFKHGYALIDGKVRGAVAGTVRTGRDGLYPEDADITLTDVDGTTHVISGTALNYHPWMPYANNFAPLALFEWRGEGRGIGHGTYMEGFRLNELRA